MVEARDSLRSRLSALAAEGGAAAVALALVLQGSSQVGGTPVEGNSRRTVDNP